MSNLRSAPHLFPTALTNFLGCHHLSVLERLAVRNLAKRPFFDDPMLDVLRERGLNHERAYVEHLVQRGKRVIEIAKSSPNAFDETIVAMRGGVDAVVQARLQNVSWAGWSDVLVRVDGESHLGGWRYEPVETKLARETRGATLIQLCLHGELLSEIQGCAPELLRVVVPDRNFEPECYRFQEFRAYFRLVRRNFEAELQKALPASAETAMPYPDPVAHCEICDWYPVCQRRWTNDDYISLVAGIQKSQRKELAAWGVTTLAGLAQIPLPISYRPSRGSISTFERLREQARLQFEARSTGLPTYDLLPIEREHGLAALPAPSPLDLFLDLEGDRQAENGGLDYLFGYAFQDTHGASYKAIWAFSPDEEKIAFEKLIDVMIERRLGDPGMHVYHYAPYEVTAMKRLMGRYGTRADELDQLLRAEVFVDLYGVVRKGLRAGVNSYSIKQLEVFYGLAREINLQQVSRHLRAVEYAIARGDAASVTPDIREAVLSYNRDDCFSALKLREWLETLRAQEEQKRGKPIPRPAPPTSVPREALSDRLARIRAVSDALTAHLPIERNREQDAQWILAQIL
jgi:predicted RecB family nuclease